MASDGVDLINKNNAGRVLLALHEEIAHPRRADADEHLDEIRTRDRKEGHPGFARYRTREQRFTGSRRADEQHALGDSAAEAREALRVLEELDYLFEFVFRFIDSGNIGESDLVRVFRKEF